MDLEVTPEQLSYWPEHPKEVRMFRHTEETARAFAGRQPSDLAVAMFAIRLPFDLPVPEGASFGLRRSVDPDEPLWVMLMVHRVRVEPAAALLSPYESGLSVLMGKTRPKLRKGSSGQTWVLASTLNLGFDDEPFELALQTAGAVTLAFERCLKAVNLVSEASRLVAGDIYQRPLTKEALDPEVAWFGVDIDTGEIGERRGMRLHTRVYNPRTVAENPEEMHQLIGESVSRRLEAESADLPHPLVAPRLLASQSESQTWYGYSIASIVTLHAAFETLVMGLYRLLLVDQGLDSTAIDAAIRASTFSRVVRGRLPEMLKGRWTGPGTAVEQYFADVYDLRNALVHEGKEPPWWRLNDGPKAYRALLGFIDERLLAAWRSHPRALVAWCDEWAGGTLPLPRAAQQVADELRQETHPYWLPRDLAER